MLDGIGQPQPRQRLIAFAAIGPLPALAHAAETGFVVEGEGNIASLAHRAPAEEGRAMGELVEQRGTARHVLPQQPGPALATIARMIGPHRGTGEMPPRGGPRCFHGSRTVLTRDDRAARRHRQHQRAVAI